eukprot:GFUD01003501.1.p1 GENE.GFUD01003501.1~~GFUD01003501.1.p1  ORF type:complete len:557 (+),score=166.63 GFUD01003501.1:112-1671(+)
MAYAYWKSGKTEDQASFDLFFRKNPFKGEFTIFAGLSDCLKFLSSFQLSQSDISYLRTCMPDCDEGFFTYLATISPDKVLVEAMKEGSVCFPRVPLMKVKGPLVMVQLLETVFLNLVNYASLVATNAARFRIAAGQQIKLFEFGLRRAQGPDGGLSASKFSYLGGFDKTSNVLAGKLFGIPVAGTHAHSYVSSFSGLDQVSSITLSPATTTTPSMDWVSTCVMWRDTLAKDLNILVGEANQGELAAFISYAAAFPASFTALLDTYDVIRSGLLNFCGVALALNTFGYRAVGVRIDSGDLAYLSNKVKSMFVMVGTIHNLPWFGSLDITASNDINEETILSLSEQGHSITCYGIGTHLVTCQGQPALGCVYKLVDINNTPKIKLSQDVEKITMPGDKVAFRLFGKDGFAILDLLQLPEEERPRVGQKVLCRHPFQESKRAYVTPHMVELLHNVVWREGETVGEESDLARIREKVRNNMKTVRADHARSLNPTPYKVSVSDSLYTFMHRLWLENAPIGELS